MNFTFLNHTFIETVKSWLHKVNKFLNNLTDKLNVLLERNAFLIGLLVVLVALFTFGSNRTHMVASDSRAVIASASWIAQGNGTTLNDHPAYAGGETGFGYWATRIHDGRIVSIYPIGASATAVPFFWLAHRFGFSPSVMEEGLLAKRIAAMMLAIAVWCGWFVMRWVFDDVTALVSALLLAAASSFHGILSQSMWIQTPALMCQGLSLALGRAWLFRSTKVNISFSRDAVSITVLILCGFFAAWATACRPNFVIWSVLMAAGSVWLLKKDCIFFLSGSFIAFLLFLGLNLITYDNWLGLYNEKVEGVGFQPSIRTITSNILGLLISPGRGLFVFSPWTITIAGGIYLAIFRRKMAVAPALILTAYCTITLLLLSAFGQWWGGWSNGPRLQADLLLAGTIVAGVLIQCLLRRVLGVTALVLLAVFSLHVQINTARSLSYPWEKYSIGLTETTPELLWDWRLSNIQWILSEGKIERRLRGESSVPEIRKRSAVLDLGDTEAFRFIHNGFRLEPEEKLLYMENRVARLAFTISTFIDPPAKLKLVVLDRAPWGTSRTFNVILNGHHLGEFTRLSGSEPSKIELDIPKRAFETQKKNVLKIEEQYPAQNEWGDSYLIFGGIAFESGTTIQ